jgi:hypothetical protein
MTKKDRVTLYRTRGVTLLSKWIIVYILLLNYQSSYHNHTYIHIIFTNINLNHQCHLIFFKLTSRIISIALYNNLIYFIDGIEHHKKSIVEYFHKIKKAID